MMPPRIDVTRAEIAIVVDLFYAKVRQHPVLGPVFGVHVTDWDHHTAKIADFWANALLHERVYDGNPMQKHLSAGNVQAEHFAIWLALFDDVLAANLADHQTRSWSALAHRIGRGLQYGIESFASDVPVLQR